MTAEVSVSIVAPGNVEAHSSTIVEVDYELPEMDADGTVEVTATLHIDGQFSAEDLDEREDGVAGQFAFRHDFVFPGDRTISVRVTAVADGEEREGEAVTELTVSGEPFDDPLRDDEKRAAISKPIYESGGWAIEEDTEERVYEEQQGLVTASGDAYTTTYVKATLQEEVAAETFDAIEQPLVFFFATWVECSPPIHSMPEDSRTVVEDVDEEARAQFEEDLVANGLRDVELKKRYTTDVATGHVADFSEYTAVYPFDDMEFEVGAGESILLEGGEIEIGVRYAIWTDGEDVFVAGGAFPTENYESETVDQFTDAIEVELEIDLGLEPDAYETELEALLRSVQ